MPHIKFRRPSPAMAVALAALFVAMGGSAVAATQLLVHTNNIANGAVTNRKLADGAIGLSKLIKPIRSELLKAGGFRGIVTGPRGFQGGQGQGGANGRDGSNGRDGANPGVAVVNVPSIASSSGKNPNPNSGDPGDGGWYFSGNSTNGCPGGDCTSTLSGGELHVTGAGTDKGTVQGGVGIAKAFNNVRLNTLNALSYDYHVNQLNPGQAPIIHITVTGANMDSKFASGFANFVYQPPNPAGVGVSYQADTLNTAASWYSTGANGNGTGTGSISAPVSLQTLMTRNPSAVISQISLDNGGSSGASGTFDAAADNLVIGFGASFTRYDFGG